MNIYTVRVRERGRERERERQRERETKKNRQTDRHRTRGCQRDSKKRDKEKRNLFLLMQDRPVLALYSHPSGSGRLAVLGSATMLTDPYIDKEDNSKVMPRLSLLLDFKSIQGLP